MTANRTSPTITLYIDNRTDRTRDVTPRQLADQFIQAVRDGYFKEPCGGGGEWAYRLWLAGRDGLRSSWDEKDEAVIFGALRDVFTESDETRAMVTRAVWGES